MKIFMVWHIFENSRKNLLFRSEGNIKEVSTYVVCLNSKLIAKKAELEEGKKLELRSIDPIG